MLCGTDPFPELFRAKRYKIHQKFLTKQEFQFVMRNLPEAVAEEEIDEMFEVADTDKDGRISYKVNNLIVNLTVSSFFLSGLPEDDQPSPASSSS